ncbi:MAG: hypothetical protein AB7F20_13385 [Geoalkalibacter sp.]|uniref:hypothetical protein n=1 Tax=Geoalkalibacter sp. TaxID=3041440 RepID=UPI003D115771
MCFKLDNGSELFSIQEMHRLRKKSSGVMGSRSWADKASIGGARSLEESVEDSCHDKRKGGDGAKKHRQVQG